MFGADAFVMGFWSEGPLVSRLPAQGPSRASSSSPDAAAMQAERHEHIAAAPRLCTCTHTYKPGKGSVVHHTRRAAMGTARRMLGGGGGGIRHKQTSSTGTNGREEKGTKPRFQKRQKQGPCRCMIRMQQGGGVHDVSDIDPVGPYTKMRRTGRAWASMSPLEGKENKPSPEDQGRRRTLGVAPCRDINLVMPRKPIVGRTSQPPRQPRERGPLLSRRAP